jgi:hypothetical protein
MTSEFNILLGGLLKLNINPRISFFKQFQSIYKCIYTKDKT